MTALLNAEFDDADRHHRTSHRSEILTYIGLVDAAGNETTTSFIGWTGKILAEHPDQRRELSRTPR